MASEEAIIEKAVMKMPTLGNRQYTSKLPILQIAGAFIRCLKILPQAIDVSTHATSR